MLLAVIFVCAIFTFIIPIVQLSIGFHYVVQDGQNSNNPCSAAPDLPLLMGIGGIFTLFFLGIAYHFLKMLTLLNQQQSDLAGKMSRLLVGIISFTFGSITIIFFFLIQKRVYQVYSDTNRVNLESTGYACRAIVLRGAFVLIILTYVSIFLFVGVYVLAFIRRFNQRRKKHRGELEMRSKPDNTRF